MDTREFDLDSFQKSIGYKFKNLALLKTALTHSSYAHEKGLPYDNERLEFLGDAVLELISSERLYHQYAYINEGKLTRVRSQMVCGKSVTEWSKRHGLERLIQTGKSLRGQVSAAMLENAGEAVFGAIFLDSDYLTAREVARKFFAEQGDSPQIDYVDAKTELQELIQADGRGIVPHYTTVSRPEPDSDKPFEVVVVIGDRQVAHGTGKSIKEAEFNAAKTALAKIKAEK